MKQDWLLLIHQLPPKPTNPRVRTWRRLQKLGAVAIKNSVYVLPFNDKTFEDFQWLKQEIESAGGQATVLHAGAVEGATDEEIIATFRKARDEEYALVSAELDGLTGAVREQRRGGHLSVARVESYEADLDRLYQELNRLIAIDFFEARGRSSAEAAYRRCRKSLLTSSRSRGQPDEESRPEGELDPARFQGRRWVTRKNLFIDRLASIWLIKRFIDKRPRFSFVSEGESVEGGITFDMYGAELTHQGEDCTFETMLSRFGLSGDRSLRQIAEIVHDIDLKDGKFNRLEAPGVSAMVRGLSILLNDDRKLAAQCTALFDGLHESLGKDESKTEETSTGKRTRRDSARKRPSRSK
ncbi:MAG TPA: chromate resistance protein ChrB domain-containing protein, partial [Vicinamibacteria bacterium]|nr:chromate resistance protein ChrB domain-containing protein [Vicinamibacteria bacterium]